MRALIFGAKGQLGRDLMRVFHSAGEVQGHDLPEVDITDESALYPIVNEFAPTIIVNAAAYTDVEAAEDDLERAFLVNEAGARNAATLAAYNQVPILYFSTDFVFNGESDVPYPPDAPIAPASVYGRSKAAGEAATRKANPHHFIVRTAWLYGPGGNNFVEKILAAAATRPELQVVEEEIGSPTHTLDLAEAAFYLARTEAYGIYHGVNRGACSRYELAVEILRIAGRGTRVTPCAADAFPTRAPRPKYSVLDPTSLEAVTNHRMRPWREALRDYMSRRES